MCSSSQNDFWSCSFSHAVMMVLQVDQEAEKWEERITQDEDNDIVKRAKNMSSMAFSMYQFTRGEGALKTTQDLFTQGEYFAEEANRLYKVVRQFSYQVCCYYSSCYCPFTSVVMVTFETCLQQ